MTGGWFGLIYDLVQRNEIDGFQVFITITFILFAIGPLFYLNERIIRNKCAWDVVSFNSKGLNSLRFGFIEIIKIKKIKINDLSNVYGFVIKAYDGRYKFSCLSFLGREGGAEYVCDKESLISIAEILIELANIPGYNFTVEKESSSFILFALSCAAMLMLIPGFIYAPQRMIFVSPFVVPIFIVLCVRMRSKKRK